MNPKHEYRIVITAPFEIEGNWAEMKPTHQIEDDIKQVKEVLNKMRPGEECQVGIEYREVLYVLTEVTTRAGYDCQVDEVDIKTQIFNSHKDAFEMLEKEYEKTYAPREELLIEADLCGDNAFIIFADWTRVDWKIEEIETFRMW